MVDRESDIFYFVVLGKDWSLCGPQLWEMLLDDVFPCGLTFSLFLFARVVFVCAFVLFSGPLRKEMTKDFLAFLKCLCSLKKSSLLMFVLWSALQILREEIRIYELFVTN